MSFARLHRADTVAFVAALALLLVLPLKWYTTQQGEQLRHFQNAVVPQANRQEVPSPSEQAAQAAATQEKTAWSANAAVDRVALVAMLAAAGLAIAAAFMRAAGTRPRRWPSPSALATLFGLPACALVAYRILEPPGLHAAAVVKAGAPLGLLCIGAVTLGARMATLRERAGPEPTAARPGAEPMASTDAAS